MSAVSDLPVRRDAGLVAGAAAVLRANGVIADEQWAALLAT